MPTGNPPWNFGSIRKLPRVTGPWFVNVKVQGLYRFKLRQWPEEAQKRLNALKARMELFHQVYESKVFSGETGYAQFEIKLPKGKSQLTTWLYDESGKAGGAYFTEVELVVDSHD